MAENEPRLNHKDTERLLSDGLFRVQEHLDRTVEEIERLASTAGEATISETALASLREISERVFAERMAAAERRIEAHKKRIHAAHEQLTAEDVTSIERKHAEAERTGQRQAIAIGGCECDDLHDPCASDHITVYAMLDGTIEVVRAHTC